MATLVPCASCRRHHADTELQCPFCRRTVDRRAVVAAMAMIGATLAGCPRPEGTLYGAPPDPPPVETEAVPAPEPAPTETAPEPAPTETAPVDPNRQAPAYGGPPEPPTAVPTATVDPRGPAEAYGAPPPPSITPPNDPR